MKTITVVAIVCLSWMEMHAQEQIKQGVYSLGGSVNYSSTDQKGNDYEVDGSTYLISPSIAYFIADQCELSANIGYQRFTSNYSSTNSRIFFFSSENKMTVLNVGLGLRYYFPAGNIAPFIGASGGTSWSSRDGSNYSKPQTNYRLTCGLEIFISETAAIEPTINYVDSHYYQDQMSSSGFQVGIGVKYFIP